jgi:hypothetical protein
MKEVKKADDLRSECKRSDFGTLVRGKHVAQLHANSNVVVLDPEIAGLFPNSAAVNAALRSLAEIAQRADSRRRRSHSVTELQPTPQSAPLYSDGIIIADGFQPPRVRGLSKLRTTPG